MLYVNADGTIRLTRGDTAVLSVVITNEVNYEEYVVQEDDTLTLSVRKTANDPTLCFSVSTIGSSTFRIKPSDTAKMNFGKYKYDVQLTRANGDVHTVIGPVTFEILQEVTY